MKGCSNDQEKLKSSSRLLFRKADRRSQLGVAFVLMAVIPLLTLGYYLTSYVIPNVMTRENVALVVGLITVLAFCGFIILRNEIYRKTDELEFSNHELLDHISERLKVEDSLRKSKTQLEALGSRLSVTQEIEKKKLAGELHDQVGGALTLLGINLAYIRDHLTEDNREEMLARLNDAVGLGKKMAHLIREVILELRPTVLDDYGLLAALRFHCEYFSKSTAIPSTVSGEELTCRLPLNAEIVLFRIAQEGMNNLAKYSQCTKASVALKETSEGVSLVIEDDGVGFDLKKIEERDEPSGFGLIMMRERAASIGGEFVIESEPGKGTRVLVKVGRCLNAD